MGSMRSDAPSETLHPIHRQVPGHAGAPSDWVARWTHLIRPEGSVLDVACGNGRHVLYLASQGFHVTGVDRDAAAVEPLRPHADILVADIENNPWPLGERQFDAVVVTNYLWRPLWPHLVGALAPGGVWIYETFARGHERLGRPSRPEFLLKPGELLQASQGLRVVAYEDGTLNTPPRFIQRLCAVKEAPAGDAASPAVNAYPLLGR